MVDKPQFDNPHTDHTGTYFWDSRGFKVFVPKEQTTLFCIPSTMPNIGSNGPCWLCQRHYQEAIERGYLW